jgi:hypothetical protein
MTRIPLLSDAERYDAVPAPAPASPAASLTADYILDPANCAGWRRGGLKRLTRPADLRDVRAAVFRHKKRSRSKARDRAPQHGVLPAPIRAWERAPDQRRVVGGLRSLAQRLRAARVLRPALVRYRRPEAGATVDAVPQVARQSTTNLSNAVGHVGEERREALTLLTGVDGSGPSTQRAAALGQAAGDLPLGPTFTRVCRFPRSQSRHEATVVSRCSKGLSFRPRAAVTAYTRRRPGPNK